MHYAAPPAESVAIYGRQEALRHRLEQFVLVLGFPWRARNGGSFKTKRWQFHQNATASQGDGQNMNKKYANTYCVRKTVATLKTPKNVKKDVKRRRRRLGGETPEKPSTARLCTTARAKSPPCEYTYDSTQVGGRWNRANLTVGTTTASLGGEEAVFLCVAVGYPRHRWTKQVNANKTRATLVAVIEGPKSRGHTPSVGVRIYFTSTLYYKYLTISTTLLRLTTHPLQLQGFHSTRAFMSG